MLYIFKYRFLCFVKNKMFLFWCLVFPIGLCTLFYFAFGNLNNFEKIEPMKVAIIENENVEFQKVLDKLSDKESENYILIPQTVNREKAEKMLKDKDVEAIITTSDIPKLTYAQSNFRVKIIESVIQDYVRVNATITSIGNENPSSLNEAAIQDIIGNKVTLNLVESSVNVDSTATYYYSAIAMSCLLGAMFGLLSMRDSQANQSARAIRLNLAPTNKMKVVAVDFLVSFILMSTILLIIFAYLILVLGIAFGDHLPLTLLLSFCGVFMSISIGVFVGSASKFSEDVNSNIISNGTIVSSFFAGLMVDSMPYIINQIFPFFKYINPATLISGGFSVLYYYEDISPVYINMIILLVMGVVFLLLAYRVLGRKAYASI